MQHVLAEVQVIAGEGSTHVVIGLVPAVCQLPELRHNDIVAAVAVAERAHPVIDLFASVDA